MHAPPSTTPRASGMAILSAPIRICGSALRLGLC
jgi:hypothetical protein